MNAQAWRTRRTRRVHPIRGFVIPPVWAKDVELLQNVDRFPSITFLFVCLFAASVGWVGWLGRSGTVLR